MTLSKRARAEIYHPLHTGLTKCQFCARTFMSAESAKMHEESRHRKLLVKMRRLLVKGHRDGQA